MFKIKVAESYELRNWHGGTEASITTRPTKSTQSHFGANCGKFIKRL